MKADITIKDKIIEKIKSSLLTAKTLPNKYAPVLEVPFVNEEIIIPDARANEDTMAMAISPAVLYFWLTNIIIKEAAITVGVEIIIAGTSNAPAIERDAKPISESPCPIKE